MNNLYIYSPDVIKCTELTYKDLAVDQMIKDKGEGVHQAIYQASEPFDFLKIIETFNRKVGPVDNLIISAEMWPYGIKLLADGKPSEHWLTIENFYEYPHEWVIGNVRLIGCNVNKKIKEDRETFAEALLEIVTGIVEYYKQDHNCIGYNKKMEFEMVER